MILLGGATSLLVGNAFQAQMPEFAHEYGHDKQDLAYSVLLAASAAGAAAMVTRNLGLSHEAAERMRAGQGGDTKPQDRAQG